MSYIRRHWRGELTLARSFWVNVVLVNLGSVAVAFWLKENGPDWDPVELARASLAVLAAQLFLLTPWQVVGCWRSATRRADETGKRLGGALVKGLLTFGLISTVGSLSTDAESYRRLLQFAMETPASEYEYEVLLLPEGDAIEVRGDLGPGLTAEVGLALQEAPDTTAIVLESDGGYVSEGEKLGALIERAGLDTYSFGGCYSACTLAFIGGRNRYLGPAANLGFHQYRGLLADGGDREVLDGRQREAQQRYREQGVAPAFADRMFQAEKDDFWFPSHDELRQSGVIEGILPRRELVGADTATPRAQPALEEQLAEYSGFALLRKYEPEQYRELVATVSARLEAGATLAEATHAASDVLMAAVESDLARAHPDTLAQLLREMEGIMESLRERHPFGCLQAFFPDQYGQLDFSRYVDEGFALRYQEILGAVLRDSRENPAPPPDPALVERASEQVIRALGPRRGDLLPENPRGRFDYERSCDAILAFLGETLRLPSPEREALLQGLFQ